MPTTGASRKRKTARRNARGKRQAADVTTNIPHPRYKITAPVVDSPYMTTTEAAAYLKVSRQFLEGSRYRGDGSGPDYIRLGRSVRYMRSVLDAWMLKNAHAADKPIPATNRRAAEAVA
jgi:hypothetical protein